MAKRRKAKRKPQRAAASRPKATPVALSASADAPEVGQRTSRPRISRLHRSNSYTDLSFPQLISIIKEAERGQTERWADLTRRMLKSDEDLVAVVDTRLDAVASARWELTAPEHTPESRRADAELAVDLCTQALASIIDLPQIFRDLMDAIGMAYGVAEILWGRRSVQINGRTVRLWVPEEILPVHPRRITFADDMRPVLRQDIADKALDGERVQTREGAGIILPPDKYIVHQPRQILDYPMSSGLFLPTARLWWIKSQVKRFWLSGAEQHANPRWHASQPQGSTQSTERELYEALEAMAADGFLVTADGVTVQDISGDFTGAADNWKQLHDVCNAGYAKLWLGSTLNVDVGDSGSRALGESQAETTIDPRRERDGSALWTTLRRDVLEPFLRFNSAPLGAAFDAVPPIPVGRFVFAEDPVNIDTLAVQSGVVRKNELRESRGLPPLSGEEGEAFIKPPQAQPFGGAAFDREPEEAPQTAPLATSRPWRLAQAMAASHYSTALTRTRGRSQSPSNDEP